MVRCLGAYLLVERERLEQRYTWRQLKRHLSLKGTQVCLHWSG